MTAPIVFLDCETTGLDPDRHEIWEIALLDPALGPDDPGDVFRPRPARLELADPNALRLTSFYERTAGDDDWSWDDPAVVAGEVAAALGGKHLVAAVPSFDAAFLDRFLRAHGEAPAWHYHLVDVEALAAGKLHLAPPWDSEELSRLLDVDPAQFARHTALGDALWARAVYEAVMR